MIAIGIRYNDQRCPHPAPVPYDGDHDPTLRRPPCPPPRVGRTHRYFAGRTRPGRTGKLAHAAARGLSKGRRLCSAEKCRTLPPARLMRYLTLDEVLELHRLCLEQSG